MTIYRLGSESNGITYDEKHMRLVKTYSAHGLMREPNYVYFDVMPPPLDVENPVSS
jgi:hypothetical protein